MDIDFDIRVRTSLDVDRLLRLAAARALDDDREQIEVRDVLIALTRYAQAKLILDELGVTEETLRAAVERSQDPARFQRKTNDDQGNATSQYEPE